MNDDTGHDLENDEQVPDPTRLRRSWSSGPDRVDLLNSSRMSWTRHRRTRRRLVLGYMLAVAAVTAVLAAAYTTGSPIWLIVIGSIASLLVTCYFIASLNAATRGVVDLRRHHVDERQRQVRGLAYERAYRLTLWCAGGVALGLLVAGPRTLWGPWLPVAALATILLLMMLPTLVIAWTESD